MPHTLSIAGWTSCVFGWMVVEQKIPLRAYVWIKRTTKPGIFFGTYAYFDTTLKLFREKCSDEFETPSKSFFEKLQELYPNFNWEISFLSEIPNRTVDAFAFLAVVALESETRGCNLSTISANLKTEELYTDPLIQWWIEKAWKLRIDFNEYTRGVSSMSSVYGAISNEWGFLVHKSNDLIPLPSRQDIRNSKKSERSFTWTNAIELTASKSENSPFEMILLDMGRQKGWYWHGELIKTAEWSKYGSELASLFPKPGEKHSLENITRSFVASSEFLTENFLGNLVDSIDGKCTEDDLFWSLHKGQEVLWYLLWKKNFENIQTDKRIRTAIESAIRWTISGADDNKTVVFRYGASIDMNYVILLPKGTEIPHTGILEEALKKEWIHNSAVIYCSSVDWKEHHGINEMSVQGIFWNEWIEVLEVFDMNENKMNYIIWTGKDFQESIEGIVIDLDYGKVFAKGIQATSKDLPSQQFLSELFRRMADSNGSKIPNDALPSSTYSLSKNEMVSKILAPFRRYRQHLFEQDVIWNVEWNESRFRIGITVSWDSPILAYRRRK